MKNITSYNILENNAKDREFNKTFLNLVKKIREDEVSKSEIELDELLKIYQNKAILYTGNNAESVNERFRNLSKKLSKLQTLYETDTLISKDKYDFLKINQN